MAITKLTASGRDSKGAYVILDNNSKFYFNDAEKTSSTKDDNLCWAGAASNMLAASGWGNVKKMKDEDDVLDYFRSSFKLSDKYGAMISSGLKWFLTGSWDLSSYSNVDQPKSNKSGGLYKGVDFSKYAGTITASPGNMATVKTLTSTAQVGVSIGFYSTQSLLYRAGGHALTCWAVSVDTGHSPDSPFYYTGLWISDPDDDRTVNKGGRKAPDKLVYLPMVWNANLRTYWISPEYNPGGGYTYLEEFTYLLGQPASYTQSGTVSFAPASGGTLAGGAVSTSQQYSIPQYTVGEEVKLSFTIENDDFADAAGGVLEIYVNGEFYTRLEVGALAPGKKTTFRNLNLGRLDEGGHLVEFFLDNGHDTSAFAEYENLVVEVTQEKEATLFFTIDNEAEVLFSEDAWMTVFSVTNYGRLRSSGGETVTLRVDGVELESSALARISAGKEGGFAVSGAYDLTPGNHYFELILTGSDGTVLDSHEFFVPVNPAGTADYTPQFILDDEATGDDQQSHIPLLGGRGAAVQGAFDHAGDTDVYSFQPETEETFTFHFAFSGAAGEVTVTGSSGQYTFGRGIHSVELQGDFTVTVTGTGDATGDYRFFAAPPDTQLQVSAPELIVSREYIRVAPGERAEIDLFLAWDPGCEITISLEELFGNSAGLSLSSTQFVFNSSNWFEAQKLTVMLDSGYSAREDLCFEFSASGLSEAWLQLSLRESAVLIAPSLLAVAGSENGVTLSWTGNADDFDYVTIRRRQNESDAWEDCGKFDVAAGEAFISGDDASSCSYSIAGVAPSGDRSDWSEAMAPGESGDYQPVAPVLNGTPYAEINLRRAQISYQRASDDRGIERYELRVGREADLSDARTISAKELSVTLNNLTNGDYYYSLRAIDRDGLDSGWSATQSFTVDYQSPEDADDYRLTRATALILNESHTESIGGGDDTDLFTVNLEAGRYQLNGDFGDGKVRATLYDSFGRKVLTGSVRNGILGSSEKLLNAGSYFLKIENRAPQATETAYTLSITGEEFQRGTPGDNLPGVANLLNPVTEEQNFSAGTDGYVGFSDPVDFYRFETERGGLFSLQLNTGSAKAKISIGTLDSKGNFRVQKSVNSGRELSGLLLDGGEYYVRIQALSHTNGRGNTNYDFTVSADLFAGVADNSDDTLKTARRVETDTVYNDWVGYGDRKDCFEFELADSGYVSLELSGLTDGGEVVKGLKLSLYDSRNRQVRLDENWTSRDLLGAGSYKVAVQITGAKQREAAYSLQILA